MNLNIKKISTFAGVGVISFLSTFQPLTNAEAALTAPASWDFKYTNEDFPGFKLRNTTSTISTPRYTRTSDGVHFNYTSTFEVVEDLDVTMTFNRSNTSWYADAGQFIPSSANIGSDNTVGTIEGKVDLTFDNQTSNNYLLFLDISSSTTSATFQDYTFLYDSTFFQVYGSVVRLNNTSMKSILIPSFTSLQIIRFSISTPVYFDAWYLQDLGVSSSYQEGFDIGEAQGYTDGYNDGLGNNPNILLNGFQAMVGILVNFMLLILNLEAFGVSILSVFGVLAFFVGVIWFFKLLRG